MTGGSAAVGIGLVCLSATFFSVMGLCMKQLRTSMPAIDIVFYRSLISLVLTAAMFRGQWSAMRGRGHGVLLLRGVSGFAALWCYVYALGVIDYAEAATLLYTSPVFTAVFATWFLGERMPRLGWLALLACLAGAWMVLKPDFSGDGRWWGGVMALLAGIGSGVAYVTVRAAARHNQNATIVFWFAGIGAVLSFAASGGTPTVPVGADWWWVLGAGLFAQLGQWFLTMGLRAHRAGSAMTGAFLGIALAAVWGWLLFDEVPEPLAAFGAILIVMSIVISARAR